MAFDIINPATGDIVGVVPVTFPRICDGRNAPKVRLSVLSLGLSPTTNRRPSDVKRATRLIILSPVWNGCETSTTSPGRGNRSTNAPASTVTWSPSRYAGSMLLRSMWVISVLHEAVYQAMSRSFDFQKMS